MAEIQGNIPVSQLKEIIEAMRKPSPLEEMEHKKRMDEEKRKLLSQKVLAKAEVQAEENRKNGCSHCVDPTSGQSVPRGSGVWNTNGQVHENGSITLICQRCAYEWRFWSTAAERNYAINSDHGLLRFAPPTPDRLIGSCTTCGGWFTEKEMETHAKECEEKLKAEIEAMFA